MRNDMTGLGDFVRESMIMTFLRGVGVPVNSEMLAEYIGVSKQRSAKKRQIGIENLEHTLSSLEEQGRAARDADGNWFAILKENM